MYRMSKSKDLIYKVRRNLWDRGYSVKDVSDSTLGFDLLVESKFRVSVQKIIDERFDASKYDIIAVVTIGRGGFAGRVAIRYVGTAQSFDGPVNAFGLPANKSKDKYEKVEGKKASEKASAKS